MGKDCLGFGEYGKEGWECRRVGKGEHGNTPTGPHPTTTTTASERSAGLRRRNPLEAAK